jgi:rubrerythrin
MASINSTLNQYIIDTQFKHLELLSEHNDKLSSKVTKLTEALANASNEHQKQIYEILKNSQAQFNHFNAKIVEQEQEIADLKRKHEKIISENEYLIATQRNRRKVNNANLPDEDPDATDVDDETTSASISVTRRKELTESQIEDGVSGMTADEMADLTKPVWPYPPGHPEDEWPAHYRCSACNHYFGGPVFRGLSPINCPKGCGAFGERFV